MQTISFASDNSSMVHPRIMEAIQRVNVGFARPYGDDEYTKIAIDLIKSQFGNSPDVYFAYNGTASNCICVKGCLRSYEAVISAATAHIADDECGACENLTGSKILEVSSKDGKIDIEGIGKYLDYKGSIHQVQPKLISITQPTELGAVYTIDEISRICDFASSNDMFVHIDGARVANACISQNTNLKTMITDTGVDLLSLGVSKNGGMFGDAVVVLNNNIKKGFEYLIKHSLNLHSKTRFISAQFIEFFKDGLFYENARFANDKTKEFYKKLSNTKIKFLLSPQANSMFIHLNKEIYTKLSQKYFFYNMHDDICRLMTSFESKSEDIDEFCCDLSKLII